MSWRLYDVFAAFLTEVIASKNSFKIVVKNLQKQSGESCVAMEY